MERTFKISLILSLLLHLSTFYLIFKISKECGNPNYKYSSQSANGRQSDGVEVEVIPKASKQKPEMESPKVTLVDRSDIIALPQPSPTKKRVNAEEVCPDKWYGGIGVKITLLDPVHDGDSIGEVYSGYPADLAGLLPGDVILKGSESPILGDPGTHLTLLIRRGTNTFKVNLMRDKVCYSNEKRAP